MLLSDELLYAVEPIEVSYLDFDDAEAQSDFEEIFEEEWNNAVQKVGEEHYEYDEDEIEEIMDENENPLNAFETETGFRAIFAPLYVLDTWGSRAWIFEPLEGLDNALARIKEEYPDISYKGCIQFFYSDSHGGDCYKREINANEIHSFVGDQLMLAFTDDEFWEKLEDAEDIDEIKEELYLYEDYFEEDTEERIAEL